jgi:predicted transglutaminase-like cysteine proteinase
MTLTLTDLKIVNSKVNLLPYKSDPERYNLPEVWAEITEDGGDCEDFALAKMHKLYAMGMPISALRLATCYCFPNKQGYHAVLLVDLDGQTYVLDNRYPLPMEYDLLPYEWDKFQIAGTLNWEKA